MNDRRWQCLECTAPPVRDGLCAGCRERAEEVRRLRLRQQQLADLIPLPPEAQYIHARLLVLTGDRDAWRAMFPSRAVERQERSRESYRLRALDSEWRAKRTERDRERARERSAERYRLRMADPELRAAEAARSRERYHRQHPRRAVTV